MNTRCAYYLCIFFVECLATEFINLKIAFSIVLMSLQISLQILIFCLTSCEAISGNRFQSSTGDV